jgi:hypothetical protein
MSDVTVNLHDLKRLVNLCFEHDIESRARTTVMVRFANANPANAIELARLIDAEKLQSRERESMRYRRLLEALGSANDVAASLADFLR